MPTKTTKLRKSSKLKFFTDYYGEKVAMNSQRLTEIEKVGSCQGAIWWTTPEALRAAAKLTNNGQRYDIEGLRISASHTPEGILVSFGKNPNCLASVARRGGGFYIGCHMFSARTFNRILRHAGVRGV